MHDITDLEARGIPGVFVASREFIDGAEGQARALGSDPAAVYVDHPIQDRTDDEMKALAETAWAELVRALTN